jgi:hypothetical protein
MSDKPDLDKMTWGEYKEKYLKDEDVKKEDGSRKGYDTDKLIQIVQLADMRGVRMFMWSDCLGNYVRVYRNSMIDCIHKCSKKRNIETNG